MQEAFVRIWRNSWRYKSNGLSPISWMSAVARNHAIDRLRARRRRGEGHGGPDDSALTVPDRRPGPEKQTQMREDAERIVRCLGELEEKKAEAVRRAYLQGETHAELSERFSVPVNTMKTWLRRSLIALRGCLER